MQSFSVSVQSVAIDIAAETATALECTDGGAMSSFIGQVRGSSGRRALEAMELHHYPGMTERMLEQLVEAARGRFGIDYGRVVHRYGRMTVGEPIVLVLTGSRHRADALAATEFLIDRLKTDAPFWKCEHFTDGERQWVAARSSDDVRGARWQDQT